ncbi:unnamed protein product [Cochlearia groenlandica]
MSGAKVVFLVALVVMATTIANGAKPLKDKLAPAPAPISTKMTQKVKGMAAPIGDKITKGAKGVGGKLGLTKAPAPAPAKLKKKP